MRPPSLPATFGSIATRVGLTAGGGGAGSLATLALVHNPSTTAVAAAAVIAALAANAAESTCKALPAIITATSNLQTARLRARADAEATVTLATVRADLARAGMEPGKAAQAAEMLRVLCMNPDLAKDRRPADETLVKLQSASRSRNTGGESGTGPKNTGNGPRRPKVATNKVVPIRSDT